MSVDEELEVEVLSYLGQGEDLAETLSLTEVDERGFGALCKASPFASWQSGA